MKHRDSIFILVALIVMFALLSLWMPWYVLLILLFMIVGSSPLGRHPWQFIKRRSRITVLLLTMSGSEKRHDPVRRLYHIHKDTQGQHLTLFLPTEHYRATSNQKPSILATTTNRLKPCILNSSNEIGLLTEKREKRQCMICAIHALPTAC